MKEEGEILKKCGTGNPFTVPENYFEQFASDLMERLPEKDASVFPAAAKVTLVTRMKPLLYLAAVFVGLMLIIKFMVYHTAPGASAEVEAEVATVMDYTDQEIERIVNNACLDDYAIYELVSSVE